MVRSQNGYQLRPVCHKALSLDQFFFLIYINDLPENFLSTVKLFADDESLFTAVNDSITFQQMK